MVKFIVNGYTGESAEADFVPATGDDYTRELCFGILTLVFSLVSLFLYAFILRIINTERDYKQNHSQRIMFHLGIADSAQLLVHASTGIYMILQLESYGWLEQFLGAIMNGMWCTSLVHTAFLAMNRAVFIVFFGKYRTIFRESVFYTCMAFCWMFFLIIAILDLTGVSTFVFVLPSYTFQYLEGYPAGGFIREFSNNLIIAEVVLAAISYVIIFTFVFAKSVSSGKELLLTLQVFFISAYSIFGYCIWTYCPIADSPGAYFASNFIWVLWSGINPYIMLAFNRRIRDAIKSYGCFQIVFHGEKRSSVVSVRPRAASVAQMVVMTAFKTRAISEPSRPHSSRH